MKQTLIDLFTSKKFLATLTALVVYVAGRFGLSIDPAKLDPIWQILLVYVGAQGVADLGKSSAQVKAAADVAAKTLPIAVLALVMFAACGSTAKSIESDAKAALVNCTGQQLGTVPAADTATLVAVVNLIATERAKCTPAGGSLDWKCVETDLLGAGRVLGGCALVSMVTAAFTKPSTSNLAASSGPPPGSAQLADFCARLAPGATYHLATGETPCP